jgi:hypothetical protein
MKARIRRILFFSTILFFTVVGAAVAQDAGMSDVDVVDDRDHSDSEKIIYAPGEAEVKFIPKASARIARDSAATHMSQTPQPKHKVEPGAKPTDKQPAKSEDDSILTFNFLYYIIQKYKIQDIID